MADKKHGKPEKEAPVALHCKFKGCKHNVSKFGFCSEHFEQFKFGLVNKNGEYCPDYDKKVDQYEHYKAGRKTA